MQFALYFIPDRGRFYDLGSISVGYDIRNDKAISVKKMGDVPISDGWQIKTKLYGFHLTITDLVTVSEEKISEVVSCVVRILKTLDFNSIELVKIGPLREAKGLIKKTSTKDLRDHSERFD